MDFISVAGAEPPSWLAGAGGETKWNGCTQHWLWAASSPEHCMSPPVDPADRNTDSLWCSLYFRFVMVVVWAKKDLPQPWAPSSRVPSSRPSARSPSRRHQEWNFFKPSPLLFISVVDPDPGGNNLGKNQKKCWIFGTGTDKWLMVTIVILFKILMNGNFALSLLFCTFEQSLMFFKQMKTLHKAIKKKKLSWIRICI